MSDRDSTVTTARAQRRPTSRPADDRTYDIGTAHDWLRFAGIMLAIVGVLNVAYGIAAVADSQFYARDAAFVVGSLKAWGWFLIVIGAVQMVVAVGVWRASATARWLALAFAVTNGLVQFVVLPAHPVWAIMIFFVDVIIVFGLLTYMAATDGRLHEEAPVRRPVPEADVDTV
jgi:hypothetical protein